MGPLQGQPGRLKADLRMSQNRGPRGRLGVRGWLGRHAQQACPELLSVVGRWAAWVWRMDWDMSVCARVTACHL